MNLHSLKRNAAAVFKFGGGVAAVFAFLAPTTKYFGAVTAIISGSIALLLLTAWRFLQDDADGGWWPEKNNRRT